jgi:hypothetical protein
MEGQGVAGTFEKRRMQPRFKAISPKISATQCEQVPRLPPALRAGTGMSSGKREASTFASWPQPVGWEVGLKRVDALLADVRVAGGISWPSLSYGGCGT